MPPWINREPQTITLGYLPPGLHKMEDVLEEAGKVIQDYFNKPILMKGTLKPMNTDIYLVFGNIYINKFDISTVWFSRGYETAVVRTKSRTKFTLNRKHTKALREYLNDNQVYL